MTGSAGYTDHDFDRRVGLFDKATGSSHGAASATRAEFPGAAAGRTSAWALRCKHGPVRKGIFQRDLGRGPWVTREPPVTSTDDRVTQAVIARGL
jgi:hypothetical protein